MAGIIQYTQEQNQSLVTALAQLLTANDILDVAEKLLELKSQRDIRDTAMSIRLTVAAEEANRLAARKKADAPAAKKSAKAGE